MSISMKLLITINFYITQVHVPLSTEDTLSISNIKHVKQCHDSIRTMSLGL